ncbi:MAG TPA: hypothetical protein VGI24_12375 [Solirubrobacteraceae bacterium]|jgi:hypothetical protein
MSTFRIARHGVDMDTGAVGVDRRGVLVVILLSAALFAGCFALGRAASPRTRSSASQSIPGLPVAFAGAASPLRLSGAPAIQLRAKPAPKHPAASAGQGSPAVAAARAHAVAPVPTPVAPRAPSPVREVASAPAPARSTAPAPASARSGEGGQSSKQHTGSGSGTSFDSSG